MATPLTAAMEMYNWLYDKVRKKGFFGKGKFNQRVLDSNAEFSGYFGKLGKTRTEEVLEEILRRLTEKVVKEEFKNVELTSQKDSK